MDIGIQLENPEGRQARFVRVILEQCRGQFPDDVPQYFARFVPGGVLFAPSPDWKPVRKLDVSTLPDMWQDMYRDLHEVCYEAGVELSFVTDQPDA